MDQLLIRITERDEPESFVGRVVEINARRYRIVEILGQGMEKLVFGLEDLADGSRERVLKIYRQRMDEAFKAHREGAYRRLRELGVPTADTEFHFIGDWLIEFEQRAALVIHAGAEETRTRMDPVYELCHRAARRLGAGDHDGAWRIIEPALASHPLQPDLLFLGTLTMCRLGDVAEAGHLANQWLETADDAEQLRQMVLTLVDYGAPRLGWALARQGVDIVQDGGTIRRLLCDLPIDHFGDLAAARRARTALATAGAEPDELADVDARIERLVELTAQLDRFADPGAPGALDWAEQAISQWPYEMHVNRLLGFARSRAKQWAACIGPLIVVSAHERRDPDVVFALGLAYLHDHQAEKAHEWWAFWARLLAGGAQRLLGELRTPGPRRIDVEEPHEAHLLLRRSTVVGLIPFVRGAVHLLQSGGVSEESCRQLTRELDNLERSLRQLPEPTPE